MQNYTLVTGASTGIGRSVVEDLIQKDHVVFAGARKAKDMESLKALGNKVIPVEVDVTKPEQLKKAFEQIKSQLKEPYQFNLVNNAGIVAPGPIEGLKLEDLRYQFEVNVIGVVGTTQVFLPLIKKNKGRIVMISSISGILSTPFLGAYSASKFALEAISDSLRMELQQSGVGVYVIQPGPITTPIWDKSLDREQEMIQSLPDHVRVEYQGHIENFIKATKHEIKSAIPATQVAKAVSDCLIETKPALRKIVAATPIKALVSFARFLPTRLLDKEIQRNYLKPGILS